MLKHNKTGRIRYRHYSPEHKAFLSEFIDRLIKAGIVRKVVTARHCSPALVAKKPNGAGYRMVLDLRSPNQLQVVFLETPALSLQYVMQVLTDANLKLQVLMICQW